MITRRNISVIEVGPLCVNCYLVCDEGTKKAVLIVPGADGKKIQDMLERKKLELSCIMNTHGHGDHIGANSYFHAPIYIHADDADSLTSPSKNLSSLFGFSVQSRPASYFLRDGEKITIDGLEFMVIHTPGHTAGSVCLLYRNVLFSGDTLFCEGVGRTDLPGGSLEKLKESIQKLYKLPDSTIVYPGHGTETTIGHEKRHNPWT